MTDVQTPVVVADDDASPPAAEKSRSAVLIVLAAVVAVGLSYLFMVVYSDRMPWMYDMHVFRKTGRLVLEGGSVYWDKPRSLFTHTPFNALLCVPVAVLPLSVVAVAWNAVELFCLQLVGWLSLRAAGVANRTVLVVGPLVVAAAAFVFDPLYIDMLLGQYKIAVLALLMIDLLVLRNSRWQGAATGALTGLYLVPGLFVVYFLAVRRWRAAATAAATFATTVAIGFVALPSDSVRYWSGLFLDSTRVGALQNVRAQSAFNLMARWLHTKDLGWWIAVGVVLLSVAAVAAAVRLERRGEPVAAVYVVGLVSVLASPIAWNHHFVWAVPALILMTVVAVRRRSVPLGLVIALSVVNFVAAPYERFFTHGLEGLQLPWQDNLAASTFALNAVLLIGVLVVMRSHRDDAPPPEVRAASTAAG